MRAPESRTNWTFVEFGTQLRRRRRSADLTQQALARAANCSQHTVKKLEQGLRRPSHAMATSLADALGLRPDERAAFVRAGTGDTEGVSGIGGEPSRPPGVRSPNPLAAIFGAESMTVHCWDRLIGRSRELIEIPRILERSRLVTLHGPGGAGKSRLAAEIARRDDSGPTLWVEFKHLAPDGSVDESIARSLQVGQSASAPLRQRVIGRLHTDDWLIVLDNCEGHTTDVAEWCSAVLDACPFVRILVTSREVTYLPGEARWPLQGLSTRATTDPGAASHSSDAVALFVERASATDPALLDHRDADDVLTAVATICDHLDGLPLAIELAAARADLYPPTTLVDRIDDDRRFLALDGARDEPRYSNLDDMVAWSYGLLNEDEQRCMRAVAIFKGSFDIDAAHAVGGSNAPLHEFERTFARLVGSSLVSRSRDSTSRFHVLETIRVAVLAQQTDAEADEFEHRHAMHFADVAELAQPEVWSSSVAAALAALAPYHADFSAAIQSACRRGDGATARRLTGSLFRYWDIHGHLSEGLVLCQQAEAAAGTSRPDIDARSANAVGTLAVFAGDVATATPAFERAAELSQAFGIGHELAYALVHLGLTAEFSDDSRTAVRLLHEAAAVARHHDEQVMEGWAHTILGADHLRHARYDDAEESFVRALSLLRGGDPEGEAWTLVGLAAQRLLPDDGPCLQDVGEALHACIELHSGWGISVSGILGGLSAARSGRLDIAADLLAQTDHLVSLIGAAHLPMMYEWRRLLVESINNVPSDGIEDRPSLADDPLDVIHAIDTLFDQLLDDGSNRTD